MVEGATREVKRMQSSEEAHGVNNFTSSANGWMNDELTADWLKTVVDALSFMKMRLVWDAYRRHISENTKKELRKVII